MGLNLTAASVVVIFDPDWNPFSDLQAQVRRSVRVAPDLYLSQIYTCWAIKIVYGNLHEPPTRCVSLKNVGEA